MRLDSPGGLPIAGSLAIHVAVAILGGALLESIPQPDLKPPPKVELVDIEPLARPPDPPPAPLPLPAPSPAPPAPAPVKTLRVARSQPAPPPTTPPPTEPPPTTTPTSTDSGGDPVVAMDDIAPAATGVAVARGPRNTGHIGRGGTGGGTGAGSGAGSADAPPTPVSVATIKTRAMPRGDFSYVDASKDYPAEAKALGIEGVIRVRLVVDDGGTVKTAVLLNKLGHGLDELALERAKKIVFDPAKDTDDKPVSSVVVWTFNMTLPK
ncbi:MAG TPA: TonB family protein [Kofleriaceae bacterium]|nr:TonB family protein [Kofleriaceae bacterium]